MGIEEKAKAYDEAVNKIKPLYEQAKRDGNPIWSTYEYLIPELRESEDERIRKHLIAIVELYWGKTNDPDKAKDLAYLEKQKEPVNGKGIYYYDGEKFTYCGYPATEENPYDFAMNQQEESLHIPETCKENADSFTSEQKVPDCCLKCNEYEIGYKAGYEHGCTAGYNKAMKEVDEQKEQKEIPLMNGDADLYFDNWIQHNDTTKRGCFEEGIKYATRLQKEQNPVDYEAELKKCKDNPLYFYDKYVSIKQKPAEWSDEDEKILDGIINTLDRLGYAEFCKSSREEDIEEERFYYKEIQCLKKLKSLRPQPKRDCKDCAMFLNGKCTKPYWKPSEEHLSALLAVFNDPNNIGSQTCQLALTDLYEQLKKLM